MATMHGHGRGKSRSHRPLDLKPEWFKLKAEEVEQIVLQLAEKGVGEAKIGLILRDTYGIPNVKAIIGKSIKKMLKEKGKMRSEIPYDLVNLIKNLKKLKRHFEGNKKDMTAKRGIQLTEAKIRRLEKYYKKKKVLPAKWKHTDAKI